MKFHNLLLLFFFLIAVDFSAASITLRMFGAKGDGKSDDTKALKLALLYSQHNKAVIDGENLTYLLSGRAELSLNHFSIRNINFITSKKYKDQFSMKVITNQVAMTDVRFDGGRGTYKTEFENWEDFSKENNTVSIYPDTPDLFYFVGLDKNAVMNFKNIKMENIHAASCITAVTFGQVFMAHLKFKNISNKTFHIYHSTDEGKYQSGKTSVEDIFAEDIGILPDKVKINKLVTANKDIVAMPQASFNFIVSFGEYYVKNAKVNNYGTSGVTSDRNTFFKSDTITVLNTSDRTFSNNPSAAVWFEGTSKINMNRVNIDVANRDKRDLLFDSSAFHIYGVNTIAVIQNLHIKGNVLNKGLRGSFQGENNITFSTVKIEGNYKQATALFSMMQKSKIETQINIGNLVINRGTVEFYGINKVHIDNLMGISGKEQVNFKLPETTVIGGNYFIKRSNIKGISKNISVKSLKIYDTKNRKVTINNLL